MNKLARSITKKTMNLISWKAKRRRQKLQITISSLQSEYNKIAEHGNDIVLKDKLDFKRRKGTRRFLFVDILLINTKNFFIKKDTL